MSTITRDERLRRQEFDDGDGDDDVWFVPTYHRYGGQKPGGSSYHTDRGCSGLDRRNVHGEVVRQTTRRAAQQRWLAPCSKCVFDGNVPADPDEPAGSGGAGDGARSFTVADVRAAESAAELFDADGGEPT